MSNAVNLLTPDFFREYADDRRFLCFLVSSTVGFLVRMSHTPEGYVVRPALPPSGPSQSFHEWLTANDGVPVSPSPTEVCAEYVLAYHRWCSGAY